MTCVEPIQKKSLLFLLDIKSYFDFVFRPNKFCIYSALHTHGCLRGMWRIRGSALINGFLCTPLCISAPGPEEEEMYMQPLSFPFQLTLTLTMRIPKTPCLVPNSLKCFKDLILSIAELCYIGWRKLVIHYCGVNIPIALRPLVWLADLIYCDLAKEINLNVFLRRKLNNGLRYRC